MAELTCDTNILFYAFDPADARKHAIAKEIVSRCYSMRAPLALQVLSEFYRAATKRLLDPRTAQHIVEDCMAGMRVVPAGPQELMGAMRLHRTAKLQFFDSLLLVTMAQAGCTVLLSEDMKHEQRFESIQVLNPFLMQTSQLDLAFNV